MDQVNCERNSTSNSGFIPMQENPSVSNKVVVALVNAKLWKKLNEEGYEVNAVKKPWHQLNSRKTEVKMYLL